MENTNQLNIALKEIQDRVIGLFRPRYYPLDQYIPVIADTDGVLTCLEIGSLLGLQTLTIGKESGRYVQFPQRISDPGAGKTPSKEEQQRMGIWTHPQKTLTDMLKEPMKFNKWYTENVYNPIK